MKNIVSFVFLILAFATFNSSCTKSEARKSTAPAGMMMGLVGMGGGGTPVIDPPSWGISISQANRMILSYLNGIDYTVNTNKTRSFFCDAYKLRSYLSDTSITKFKFVLAHSMAYINGGGEGKRPGFNENGLTLVIVGVDSTNKYVSTKMDKVLDQLDPCPDQCALTGDAANNLIVN